MKKLSILIFLVACSGTNVGNGFRSDIVVSGDESAIPSALTTASILSTSNPLLALNSWIMPSSAATLQQARAQVGAVVLLPQDKCDSRPPVNQWKVFSQDNASIDFGSAIEANDDSSDLRLNVELSPLFSTCTIRFVLRPSERAGEENFSLFFQWTTAGGRSVTVQSTSTHILGLRSSTVLTPQILESGFESVLYRNSLLNSLSIPNGDGSPLVIDPVTNPVLFRGFLRSLRQSFGGHALQNGRIRQRNETLAQGSDDEDQVEENLSP